MKALTYLIISAGLFIATVIFVLALSKKAEATERDYSTPQYQYIYVNKNEDTAKYVIGGALLTCAIISLWRQRWCWEEKTPEPFPDPGPAVKDVTPEIPVGVRLYHGN